jgi:glycerol-3-phosphate acyltransferase PlsY
VALGVFLAVVLLSRYVSLGSLLAALSLPVFLWASGAPVYLLFLGTAMFALVALRHRANLRRLWTGTEHRVRLHRPT